MNVNEELDKGLEYFIEKPGQMVSLYKFLYGETINLCKTCPNFENKIKEKFNYLIKKSKDGFPTIRMKPGKNINTYMWNNIDIPKGHWTSKNIYDELAEKFIKLGYQDYFIQ